MRQHSVELVRKLYRWSTWWSCGRTLWLWSFLLAGSCVLGRAEGVAVDARLEVKQGKLVLAWANPAPEPALVGLYGGDEKLAGLFKQRTLEEINIRLGALHPLVEWKAPTGDPEELRFKDRIGDHVQDAAAYDGPLGTWLSTYVPQEGRFYDYRPTQPAQAVGGDEAEPEGETVLATVREALQRATADLIARVHEDDMTDGPPGEDKRVKIWFAAPVPLAKVSIAGMDFPLETAGSDAERALFQSYHREKAQAEAEMTAAVQGERLCWNDDLAVQRLMTIWRARGWWDGFEAGAPDASRSVRWLALSDDGSVATVSLPHLSFLVFEQGADSDEMILRVGRALLRPAEVAALEQALTGLQNRERGVKPEPARAENGRLLGLVRHKEGRRVVDLFAVGSYLRSQNPAAAGLHYSALPVGKVWLDQGRKLVEEMGCVFSAGPTMTDANRLVGSRNKHRRENDRGGMEVWVSPRPGADGGKQVKPVTAGEPDDAGKPANPKPAGARNWFQQQRIRAEFGLSKAEEEKTSYVFRISSIDQVALGQLALELHYQDKLSGQLEWIPLPTGKEKPALLPDSVELFSESITPRTVDGQPVALQKNGLRLGKRTRWRVSTVAGDPSRWLEMSAQVAKVRDQSPAAMPTSNEVSASWGLSSSASENPWDVRSHRGWKIRATGAARGTHDLQYWGVLEAAAQVRIPHGPWSYYASMDARWVVGRPPLDALPFVGGNEGVRGVPAFAVPVRGRCVFRNELWFPLPFIARDVGAGQTRFRTLYELLKPAVFIDAAWADRPHLAGAPGSWFVSPGVGMRLLLGPAHLGIDYAYGITRPSQLGGHRFSLGITARY